MAIKGRKKRYTRARCAALCFLLLCAFTATPSARPLQVSLELVLAVDISASVDEREYGLQMQGIAAAFQHTSVIAAIERLGNNGLAVAVIHWSQNYATRTVVPFTHVYNAQTAMAFAARVSPVVRATRSNFTAVGAAIIHSVKLLEENAFAGARRTIDISGDGRSNAFPLPAGPRGDAARRGITINGLAIASGDGGLARYYREEVITGAGSFVEVARDYTVVAPVMLRKLLREIAPPMTHETPAAITTRHANQILPGARQYRTSNFIKIANGPHDERRTRLWLP